MHLQYVPFFLQSLFFFNDTPTTEIYTLSLHDALPILSTPMLRPATFDQSVSPALSTTRFPSPPSNALPVRSEEHTSELQSRRDLVCRLLLEKKKQTFRQSIRLTD